MSQATAFTLNSPDFDGHIPDKFTCHGGDTSPALTWENAPANTQSFVLIVDDPDAPVRTWVHWVVYNIPGSVTEFDQGNQQGIGGTNTWGNQNYGGPCPPSGTHHYHFKLYALDTMLDLPNPASLNQIMKAMKSHVLDQAELIGLYP
ncbi:MAG: YbhB/YbcL family Raf kinase inhibitor-like protein [Gammaproteobacteria bacterium]